MPAYSFKHRFILFVKDGSKRHTIRKRRLKGFAKQGDPVYLYFGLRTKWCTKLKEGICSDVKTIVISKAGKVFLWNNRISDQYAKRIEETGKIGRIPDKKLSPQERDRLAWKDGFRPDGTTEKNPKGSFDLMLRFWKQTHSLPFVGDIIYW